MWGKTEKEKRLNGANLILISVSLGITLNDLLTPPPNAVEKATLSGWREIVRC